MNRLLFSKQGDAVWISHLDLMRMFQRAFRRAGLLLRHSQGFTPHAYVSILLPMSVGVSSQCEILDFELEQDVPLSTLPARLNAVLPDGIQILSAYQSTRKAGQLSFLKARLTLEYDRRIPPDAEARICALWAQPELLVRRRTKRGEADCNLIPMLREFSIVGQDEHSLTAEATVCAQNPSLNPQLLIAAIRQALPDCAPDFSRIHRLEIYAADGSVFR